MNYIACSECINNDEKWMETFVDLKKHHQSCEKPWNSGEWRHSLKMQATQLLVLLVHKSTCLNNRQDYTEVSQNITKRPRGRKL